MSLFDQVRAAAARIGRLAGDPFKHRGQTLSGIFRSIDSVAELALAGIEEGDYTRLVAERSQFKTEPQERDEITRGLEVYSVREIKTDQINFSFLLRRLR